MMGRHWNVLIGKCRQDCVPFYSLPVLGAVFPDTIPDIFPRLCCWGNIADNPMHKTTK